MQQVPVKISQDEREELNELLDGQGWPLVLRIAEALVKEQANRLLSTPSSDSAALVIEKAKHEGAKALLQKLTLIKEQYKQQA